MAREYLGLCPTAPTLKDLVVGQNSMGQMVASEEKASFIFTSGTVLVRHQAKLELELKYCCHGSVYGGEGETQNAIAKA